jgi:hypothetical protein
MNNLVQQISNSKSIDQQIADLEAQINLLKAEKEYETVWNQALTFSSYSDRVMFIRKVTATLPIITKDPVRKIIYQDCGIYNEEIYSEIVDLLIDAGVLNEKGLFDQTKRRSLLTGLCARIYHSTAISDEFRKKNVLYPHIYEFINRHMKSYDFTSTRSFAAAVSSTIRRRNANKAMKTTPYDYLEFDPKTGKYTFKYKY